MKSTLIHHMTVVDRICGVWLSLCVCVRLASRVCLACVSRLRASVSRASRVCLRLFTSRVPNACVCSRLSASVVLSRVCASASVSHLSRVGRLVSRLSRVRLASVCVCSRHPDTIFFFKLPFLSNPSNPSRSSLYPPRFL